MKFAVRAKQLIPINDAVEVKAAWSLIDATPGLTSGERSEAHAIVLDAAQAHGIDTSSWMSEMSATTLALMEVVTDGMVEVEETTDAGEKVKVKKQAGPMKVRFRGTRANVRNENGRLYPDQVMTDAVNRAIERYVKPGRMVGETPHPKHFKRADGKVIFDTQIQNGVIKVNQIEKQGLDVFLDAEVLETAKGRDLKAQLAQGVRPGISMRALGLHVDRMVEGQMTQVATYLDMQSFDIVTNNATEDCEALEVLTDSVIEKIIEGDIEEGASKEDPNGVVVDSMIASCPHCGTVLVKMDPDNDGDTDFLVCPPCASAFIQASSTRQTTEHEQSLRKVTPDNWDGYGLAREWLEKNQNTMTDSVRKEGEIMDNLGLIKAFADPAVRAAMADASRAVAQEVAQPALDAVEAQKAETAKAEAKAEAKAWVDSTLEALKPKVEEKALTAIRDSIGEAPSKEIAQAKYEAALSITSGKGAQAMLDSMSFDPANASQKGRVRVEMGEPARPYMPIVDGIGKEMDEYGAQFGNTFDPKLRELNKKQILSKVLPHMEQIIGPQRMTDSAKVFTDGVMGGELMQDSLSVTTTQLLNQPTILTAVIVQAFQDVESAQFMFTDVFRGAEWRQPIETFTSAATYNPNTGILDLAVPEGQGITASAINLGWQSFSPTWRRNAISLTTDVIRQLQSGPVNYAAIARAAYHISEDKKRRVDNAAYLEMVLAADEYQPLAVVNETPASAGLVTATGVPTGSNAGYLYKLVPGTVGYEAPTVSSSGTGGVAVGGNPVVRPRSVNQIQPNGQVTALLTNAISVKTNQATPATLVLGAWDGLNIVSFTGTVAQAAFDFEHGILYLMPTGGTGGSGINPAAGTPILPVITYSAVTNYDRWHYTMGTGYTDQSVWNNTLLNQLTNTQALMGSSPRYMKPNLVLFSLQSATWVENAQIFYKLAQPDGTRLLDTGNTFGMRAGMNLSKINAPWVCANGRILLTKRGSTRYGIETPFELKGPYPVYDSSQNIIDGEIWYGRENSVLATPQVRDTNGVILNPVGRTVIIEP